MLKKISIIIAIMLIAMMPLSVYADTEAGEEVIPEEVATEETANECEEETSSSEEIAEEPEAEGQEDATEESVEEATEPDAEEEVSAEDMESEDVETSPEVEETEPEEEILAPEEEIAEEPEGEEEDVYEEDVYEEDFSEEESNLEDFETSKYDAVIERALSFNGTELDISDLMIPSSEMDDLAGTLSIMYDNISIVEENGYIVAIIFDDDIYEDETEDGAEVITEVIIPADELPAETFVLAEISLKEEVSIEETVEKAVSEPSESKELVSDVVPAQKLPTAPINEGAPIDLSSLVITLGVAITGLVKVLTLL